MIKTETALAFKLTLSETAYSFGIHIDSQEKQHIRDSRMSYWNDLMGRILVDTAGRLKKKRKPE
jgi:hypothetical protein